ncbi:MAG: B12-binding domain-containing radical SAM protein [Nanoarchaeota archaeon]|nr:B12-binding domain-containing radical SAM protein [Nanoarchaeota archaeon]
MKILMIVPKYRLTNYKDYGYFFPLGLAYISAVIKRAGYELDCLNLNHFEGKIKDIIKSQLENKSYDIVCTGYLAIGYAIMEKIINAVKNNLPDAKIILGGAIITTEPELMLDSLNVDYGVMGEGEATIIELLDCIKNNNDLSNVDGICYKDKEKNFILTNQRKPIGDLDSLPIPDLDGLGFKEYLDNQTCQFGNSSFGLYDYPRQYQILCSRGCPNHCTFCYHILKKYRVRSLDSIFDEIESAIKKYNINFIFLEDDLFSINKERLFDFCKRMKALNERISPKVGWFCSLTVRNIDDSLLSILKDAGCQVIGYGFESYSQKVLNSMKKPITPEEINNAFHKTMNVGIAIQGNFIFGDTAETKETVRETIDWWKKNTSGQISLEYIQPYPGSEIYNRCIKKGIIKDKLDFIKNKLPFINWFNMTDKEIKELKDELLGMKKYYAYAVPLKIKKTKRNIYELKVECPSCKKIIEYKNTFIDNRFRFTIIAYCRKCFFRFFIFSWLKRIQINNYEKLEIINRNYVKIRDKILKSNL